NCGSHPPYNAIAGGTMDTPYIHGNLSHPSGSERSSAQRLQLQKAAVLVLQTVQGTKLDYPQPPLPTFVAGLQTMNGAAASQSV
ncbi:hypothetical protein WI664_07565, partial [Vibrio cholerae]